ncbi:MAG: TRAP transporter substrate-binding protein [Gammaproteobacteria bacterium]|jgi:TRAP-type mannitol/chloroaromatic compound transport system substrate-binding protein
MKVCETLVCALMAAFLLSCAPAEQPGNPVEVSGRDDTVYSWKLITTWPKNLPALGTAPERLADMVDTMSRGRLKIKVYGAGELVPAFEVFDAVAAGTAEMGHGAAYYWRGKIPVAAIFSAVPFGLTAQEMNGWLHYGGGLELWRELYEPFGLIPMASGNTGVQMAGWFNKEINSIEDIKGLKMRIPGLGGEVFQRAGGVAVSLPGGEIFTALQTGTIDATEWVGPYNDRAFGLHTVAKYYYYPGWQEPGPALEAIVNKQAFESLPEDLRMILTVASRAINADMLDEFTAKNNLALKELVEKQGVELRRLPDDVLERFKEISRDVVAELADDNELSQRIYRSFEDFREGVVSYHAISEQAYINAR